METRFQTSFIPKKAMPTAGVPGTVGMAPVRRSPGTGSWFMTISVIIFICSLLSVGGAYLWVQYLQSSQASYSAELKTREQQFNLDLIEQLQSESIKLSLAKGLLADHLAMSKVFGIVAALTAEEVRFTGMTVAAPSTQGGDVTVTLTGYGKDLSAVAFQSDVLGALAKYGLRNIVKNPIISNPSLDQAGTVSFGLSAAIDPSSLYYETAFAAPAGSATANLPASSQGTQNAQNAQNTQAAQGAQPASSSQPGSSSNQGASGPTF